MHNTYSVKDIAAIFGLQYHTMRRNLQKSGLHKYPRTSRYGKYNAYEVGDALFGFDKTQTDAYINEWKENQLNG